MILSVHQPQYLPWLGYFDKIARSDCFVFLDEVQYKVREFQNRNKIRTNDGWIWLTVPVMTHGLGRQKIKEVMIDNEFDWQKKHLGSLANSYQKSPFFRQSADFLNEIYSKKWEKLIDLNICIIKYILKVLGIKTSIRMESEVGTLSLKTDRIIELCKKLNADTYLSGSGGRNYLEEEKFKDTGINLCYQDFIHPQYRQGYSPFLPYMSILDLLFNEGDNSIEILTGEKKNV